MKTLRLWWRRCLGAFPANRNDSALADELHTHIDMQIDENVRAGMPLEEARRQAHITFGTVDAAAEGYRDQRGLPILETTLQDLGYALRSMRGNPGFTLVAVLSIAIGIGANTAIFSVVKTVLLDPLGYREPERLFAIREAIPSLGTSAAGIPASPLHAREWGVNCPSIEQIGMTRMTTFHLAGTGEPEQVLAGRMSANLPSLLGVAPMAGRTFMSEEEQPGKERVVLLSESLWRRRFQAGSAVIGSKVLLDGDPYIVAGVMPGSFRFPFSGGMSASAVMPKPPEVFVPLVVGKDEFRPMGNFNFGAVARLKPGVTVAQALTEINAVQKRFPAQAGEKVELRALLLPIGDLFTGNSRTGLWMLLAAVGAVMLIVCVNLANLLLAKNSARRRESAIRSALGASAGRQLRQGLTESLALSLAGGGLGIAVAAAGLQAIVRAPPDVYRITEVSLDLSVLGFALLVSAATGLIFGVLPAWQLSGTNPIEALQSGASRTATAGRSNLGTRRILIGVEVALSTALLILGGLLINSFVRLVHVEKGFQIERVLAVDLAVPAKIYADRPARGRLLERTVEEVKGLPGVESAGLVTMLPARGETWIDPLATENDTRPVMERPMVNHRLVSDDYFRAMKIEIRQGRAFEATDEGKLVGILSEKAVAKLWPGERNPVGRQYKGMENKLRTLVGVAADVRATVDKAPAAIAYYPFRASGPFRMTLVVRTAADDPMSLAPAIRSAIWNEESQMPIPDVSTMSHVVETSMAQRRFQLMLVIAFSSFALLVAALGVYGVVAFTVARRRNELGIRLALGAQPKQVMRAVIGQGLAPVAMGLAAGVAVALGLSRLIQGLLFEVRPADPATIAGVCAAVLIVAAAACSIPAWRAVSGNPVAALRID